MTRDKTQKPKAANGAGADSGETVKLKDLVDRLAGASGARKADVKKAVEAMLSTLVAALEKGESLALPPLGRLSVVKRKSTPKGDVLTLKLRRAGEAKSATEALAAESD